jgi:hypothetical protein
LEAAFFATFADLLDVLPTIVFTRKRRGRLLRHFAVQLCPGPSPLIPMYKLAVPALT